MNNRAVSLPELVTERRRNTALSLSEGFAGARHEGALSATAQTWCPRPGAGAPMVGEKQIGADLARVLPMYYRTRQMALATEKAGHRMPGKIASELKALERALAREIKAVHPLLFQRFDEVQLDRLLRAMPFLRLSAGRWIFGSEGLGAEWPETKGDRAFLLLQGKVTLYPDPEGAGNRTEVVRGDIFGDKSFSLCDESMLNHVGGAAHCEEPCIVAILQTAALEAAYADRAFGNARIVQTWRKVPSYARICQPEEDMVVRAGGNKDDEQERDSMHGAIAGALRDISKVVTACHFRAGEELLSPEALEESVCVVSKGVLEVRGDITLTEKLDALPPKKVRMRVNVVKATNLAGDSIWDKLDPYVMVKLGDFKKGQSPVLWNVGPNPKFDFTAVFTFADEDMLTFTVMDRDQYSADDLCGSGSISCKEIGDGYTGVIQLTRPKKGIFNSNEESLEEPAGKLHVKITYDLEKVSALSRVPKSETWRDQELFLINEQECWGHEQVVLQSMFMRTLEQATASTRYMLQISNVRIVGGMKKGGTNGVSVWKVGRPRFMEFVRHSGREKPFLQACRVSSLEKQNKIKNLCKILIRKWEIKLDTVANRKGLTDQPEEEQVIMPSTFRIAYRGMKAHVSVRNALNLTGGGLFDKLDPYAVLKFQGSKQAPFKTSVLQDAGADPQWDNEKEMLYNGETVLKIEVWDYDRFSEDDLIGVGTLTVEHFCNGFEGMIPLTAPGNKKNKRKTLKPMMITIGIQWPPLPQSAMAASATTSQTMRSIGGALANSATLNRTA